MTVVINGTNGITSVNGTAAAPSVTGTDTDTGIVYGTNTVSIATGGTERLQVDSSGNVAIGTTPGSLRLELSGASAGSSFNAFRIGNTDTTASSPVTMFFLSADDGTARNRATIASGSDGSNSGYIALSTRSSGSITEKLRLNSTGAVVLAGGTTTANGVGITFPATQSASTDANTLDDYEEGTWTPNQGSGLTVSGSFSSSGRYTKIGRLVYVDGAVSGSTNISVIAVGVLCTNLPFVVGSTSSTGLGGLTNNSINQSNTCWVNNATGSSVLYATQAISATSVIWFSVTYLASA